MNGSREATAVSSHNGTIDDEIYHSVVDTVSFRKRPLKPISELTYHIRNFLVVKVNCDRLELLRAAEMPRVFTRKR